MFMIGIIFMFIVVSIAGLAFESFARVSEKDRKVPRSWY